jgi:hypothetical protein
MKLKVIYFLILAAFTTLSGAQTFEEEYQTPEYEDEMLTEDMYYQTAPLEEYEAQEEATYPVDEREGPETEEAEFLVPIESN